MCVVRNSLHMLKFLVWNFGANKKNLELPTTAVTATFIECFHLVLSTGQIIYILPTSELGITTSIFKRRRWRFRDFRSLATSHTGRRQVWDSHLYLLDSSSHQTSFQIVVKYTQHEVYTFNHFLVFNFVSLYIFTMLYNRDYYLFPKFFITQNRNCVTNNPTFPLPQALISSSLLCVSINLPILGTSFRWNHKIFVLL